MKKHLSGLLIFLMLLQNVIPGMAAQSSHSDKPVLIYTSLTNEEQATDGTLPYGFVWSGNENQNGRVVAGIEEVTGSGNSSKQCVRIRESSVSTNGFLYHALAYAGINKINNNGKYVVSFKISTADTNALKRIRLIYNANVPQAFDYIDKVDTEYSILDITTSITAFGKTLVDKVDLNKWYDISYVFDLNKQSADVYVDGSKTITATLPQETHNFSAIKFMIPTILTETAESSYCFDDFRIYAADAPLSDAEFTADWAKYRENEWTPTEEFSAGILRRYDKFCYQLLYDRFVTADKAFRFYKNNRFYDLPVRVEKIEGTYLVPLKAFAESFGASVSYNYEDKSVLVQHGNNTLRCTIGSDIFYINDRISKSRHPLVSKEGNACIPLNILSVFFDFDTVVQDDLICLDGKKIDIEWKFDELLKEDRQGNTMDSAIMEQIINSMLFERPTPQEILDVYNEHNTENVHPKLIVEPGTFDLLKEQMKTNKDLEDKVNRFIAKCEAYYDADIVKYETKDGLRMNMATELYERGIGLSFAYIMTGEERYKDRLWENLEEASTFPDFNPGHFLDVGNAGIGVTVAYDWLYDEWAKEPEKLEIIEKMMLENVLKPITMGCRTSNILEGGAAQLNVGSNQNVIINTAGIGAAINLIEKYPEIATRYLSFALRSMERTFLMFAPDGGYEEGVAYWAYVMRALPYAVENIQNGIGSDFGLRTVPGLSQTAYYPIMAAGTEGAFDYGDSIGGNSYDSSTQWFAKEFNDESLAVLRSIHGANFDIKDVLYHIDGIDKNGEITLQKDMCFQSIRTAMLRSGWNDSDIAVCLHGGAVDESHGHEDNGSFILDAFGERWACELPYENYNLRSYGSYTVPSGATIDYKWLGKYYRNRAEGHNTVIANPNSESLDMVPTAVSDIIKFSSEETGGYAICDMTETNELYECALRGIKLDRSLQEVVVQDNFRASENTDFYWFMHTQAEIELTDNNKTAILTKNGKRLWVSIISDGDETFQAMDAEPLPIRESPPVQTPNDGYRKLYIHKANSSTFNVSIAFKQLLQDQTQPNVLPKNTPMETWKFTSDESSIVRLSSLELDGEVIDGFSGKVNNYSVNLLTEKSEIPTVTAQTDSDCKVEVIQATTLPGVASILLLDEEDNQLGIYNVVFRPINDTTKFLNDKQIPIMAYEVSSEPQAENGVVNLFDASLSTKFATDEKGGAVTLDFGETVELAEIKMAFTNGDTRQEFFTIEVSDNGYDWNMVLDNGASSGTTKDYQSFTFAPVNTRYARVRFYGNSSSAWVSVSELCAFRK